jgi:DNA-binding transcriptional regulator LsrR (DeoR family)
VSAEQPTLERVALLYYDHNLTQEEIAARLSLSRSKVVRLLQEARRRGIVQIRVVTSQETHIELERALEARFDLRRAVFAPTSHSPAETTTAVGIEGARLLADLLKPGDTIVVSSGRTLGALVRAMQPTQLPGLKVVEMQGLIESPTALPEFGTDQLAARLAHRLNAQYRLLPVPRHLGSAELVSALLSDGRILSTLQLARAANIAVMGIGGMDPPSPTLPLSSARVRRLLALGAVGEISGRFFDAAGRACPSDLDQCLVGLTLAEIARVPVRIAVACGRRKIPAIAGALAGRLANVLVTDVDTAVGLIDYAGPGDAPAAAHSTRRRAQRAANAG